LKQRKASNIQ